MVTMGISIIYSSKVTSYASQYQSDLRKMKNDTMSSQGDKYYLQWQYNSAKGYYYYDIYHDFESTPDKVIKHVEISGSVAVELDKGSGFKSLNDASYTSNPNQTRIQFDPSSGKLVSVDTVTGAGDYRFVNKNGDDTITVTVIEETGRVFYDD